MNNFILIPLIIHLMGFLGFQELITQLKMKCKFIAVEILLSRHSAHPVILVTWHLMALQQSISVIQGSDTISFHFDTGATGSEFYGNYFNRYKSAIIKK